jgi:hypothetical protein
MSKSKTKPQPDSSTIKRLTTAIEQATRSAKFFVAGCLSAVDPHIVSFEVARFIEQVYDRKE